MSTENRIDKLILFDSIREDTIARQVASYFESASDRSAETYDDAVYYDLQRRLLGEIGRGEIKGNLLQNHFCRLIATEENVFTHMAEAGLLESPSGATAKAILKLAATEIDYIRKLYLFVFPPSYEFGGRYSLLELPAISAEESRTLSRRENIHKALMYYPPVEAAALLAAYHRSYGAGLFETSAAFSYGEEGLKAVDRLDPITFDDLIGNENQKRILNETISAYLKGLPVNNILLYGDSGTGKSSSVKALLNKYQDRGLKLVSIARNHLEYLPDAMDAISGSALNFIIYIDDLSFEEHDDGYKVFKSIIEGGLSAKPDNAIFVVTSNRKNIIHETWSDRSDSDEVRRRDTMQEKQSLSDRFGITIVYSEPSKEEYIMIVKAIASKAGLDMPESELVSEAQKWELRCGGRTGRAARQFVDYMIAERSLL